MICKLTQVFFIVRYKITGVPFDHKIAAGADVFFSIFLE